MPPAKRRATADAPAIDTVNPKVLLLTGSEAAGKAAEARRLIDSSADAECADFDVETLDGNTTTADRVLSAAALAPFGTGRRVVHVRDAQQLDGEEQKRIAAGLEKIPASGLLILQAGAPVYEDGRIKRASVVATELSNAVKKWGRVVDFSPPKAEDAAGWIQAMAHETGKTVSGEAMRMLTQLSAEDMPRVQAELAKAAAHAGDSPTITGADIEATLSRSPDDVIFKLCDAIGNRRAGEALGHVSTLFKGGGRPDAVAPRALVLLARQIRLISQFHYLAEKRLLGGSLPPEVADVMPAEGAASVLANPRTQWMARKYAEQARRFTGAELAERMDLLLETDLMLKGVLPGGDSPKAALQRLVAQLC